MALYWKAGSNSQANMRPDNEYTTAVCTSPSARSLLHVEVGGLINLHLKLDDARNAKDTAYMEMPGTRFTHTAPIVLSIT